MARKQGCLWVYLWDKIGKPDRRSKHCDIRKLNFDSWIPLPIREQDIMSAVCYWQAESANFSKTIVFQDRCCVPSRCHANIESREIYCLRWQRDYLLFRLHLLTDHLHNFVEFLFTVSVWRFRACPLGFVMFISFGTLPHLWKSQ